jgi:hypothetical protein
MGYLDCLKKRGSHVDNELAMIWDLYLGNYEELIRNYLETHKETNIEEFHKSFILYEVMMWEDGDLHVDGETFSKGISVEHREK